MEERQGIGIPGCKDPGESAQRSWDSLSPNFFRVQGFNRPVEKARKVAPPSRRKSHQATASDKYFVFSTV